MDHSVSVVCGLCTVCGDSKERFVTVCSPLVAGGYSGEGTGHSTEGVCTLGLGLSDAMFLSAAAIAAAHALGAAHSISMPLGPGGLDGQGGESGEWGGRGGGGDGDVRGGGGLPDVLLPVDGCFGDGKAACLPPSHLQGTASSHLQPLVFLSARLLPSVPFTQGPRLHPSHSRFTCLPPSQLQATAPCQFPVPSLTTFVVIV